MQRVETELSVPGLPVLRRLPSGRVNGDVHFSEELLRPRGGVIVATEREGDHIGRRVVAEELSMEAPENLVVYKHDASHSEGSPFCQDLGQHGT